MDMHTMTQREHLQLITTTVLGIITEHKSTSKQIRTPTNYNTTKTEFLPVHVHVYWPSESYGKMYV